MGEAVESLRSEKRQLLDPELQLFGDPRRPPVDERRRRDVVVVDEQRFGPREHRFCDCGADGVVKEDPS